MKRVFISILVTALVTQSTMASDFATQVMNATFKLFHPDSTATCFFVRLHAQYVHGTLEAAVK